MKLHEILDPEALMFKLARRKNVHHSLINRYARLACIGPQEAERRIQNIRIELRGCRSDAQKARATLYSQLQREHITKGAA